jgi:hypothetical protein
MNNRQPPELRDVGVVLKPGYIGVLVQGPYKAGHHRY